jgi:uncharacterized membrane protein
MTKSSRRMHNIERDNDKWWRVWFGLVGILTLATIAGVVWLIAYVVPHIVGLLDRIH